MQMLKDYGHLVWAWIVANPAWSAPVIGALFTILFKPRSADEYSLLASRNPVWFFSRWAAFVQLVGAIFPDAVKSKKILFKVIYGKDLPPVCDDGPTNPGMPLLLIVILCATLGGVTTSCTRMQAINVADLFAEKIQCALANADLPNDQIVARCAIQQGDVEKVLTIVGEHRSLAAKQAAQAANRVAYDRSLEDMQKKSECSRALRDGGK